MWSPEIIKTACRHDVVWTCLWRSEPLTALSPSACYHRHFTSCSLLTRNYSTTRSIRNLVGKITYSLDCKYVNGFFSRLLTIICICWHADLNPIMLNIHWKEYNYPSRKHYAVKIKNVKCISSAYLVYWQPEGLSKQSPTSPWRFQLSGPLW